MDLENNKNSSLNLLHAYDSTDSNNSSDDDEDKSNKNLSNKELKNENNKNIQQDIETNNIDMSHREVKPWIGELSCDDDDSDSSSSSEWESLKGDDGTSDSDDDNVNASGGGAIYCNKKIVPRVKGELALEDLPPIEDLTITVPNEECVHIGSVYDIIDQLVIVKTLPEKPTLDLDTVLFLEEGAKPLGQIYDVFGQVTQPFYCVRFNSNNHIKDKGIERNMLVYYAPKTEYTHLVYAADLMKAKGSDASWKDDVEVPEQLCDYSDDEQERKAKQQMKEKKKKNANPNNNDEGETSSGNKKAKLTPFEIKMNKINLEKSAELKKNHCGRGRGRVRPFLMMEQPNQSMEIRQQGPGISRLLRFFPEFQRSTQENNPFETPFEIPHGFRVFPTHCPRFPPVPGTIRNPVPMNRAAFSPPPGQPFSRPPLFGRANIASLAPRFRNSRSGGGGSFFPDERPNF